MPPRLQVTLLSWEQPQGSEANPAMSRDLPQHFTEEQISPEAAVEPHDLHEHHTPALYLANPSLPKSLPASVPPDLLSRIQWILESEKPILQL